jgi:hypothetical protein
MSQSSAPFGPEQQELVGRLGRELLRVAPAGWRQIRAEYRAAGRHVEADVFVTGPDGVPRPVQPPVEVVQGFGQLRHAMYEPGRGTWLSAEYVIEPSGAYHVEFEPDVEPRWRRLPPPIGFQDELRFFPRADARIPDWWRQRAGLPPAPPAPQPENAPPPAGGDEGSMRTPRVYDGLDEGGRPVLNREPLPPAERDRVLAYLEAAPVVLAARSYDTDAFAPGQPPEVPMNFRTDGVWVWPGAVAYYLRKHDVPPDPELVAHIRGRGFDVPEVDDATRDLAVSTITGGH